jgi:vacuolar-type H+-ATPase subunit F/Vma7
VQQAALEAERTQLQAALTSLKQQGVQVIVKREDQYIAIIGDQEVRVGDEYQGFTVVAIDPDSNDPDNIVRLSKDLSP